MSAKVNFTYNGRRLSAEEGMTVAEALRANGVRLGARSMRLRIWRDEYHPFKEVPSAWVCIDGVANINAHRTRVREGMKVLPQTRGTLLSYIGRYSGTGFYYRNFTRSELARNFFFERVRSINDYGGPLDPELSLRSSLPELDFRLSRSYAPDLLIIGAGRSGLAALASLHLPSDSSVMVIENLPRSYMEDNFRQLLHDLDEMLPSASSDLLAGAGSLSELAERSNATVLDGTTVFGAFNGSYAAVEGYSRVLLLKPRFTLLCTGSEEVKPVFRNNDMPGVITSRTLLSMPAPFHSGSWGPVLYLERPLSLNYLTRVAAAARVTSVFTGFTCSERYRASLSTVFGIDPSTVLEGWPVQVHGAVNLETAVFSTPGGSRIVLPTRLLIVAGRKQPRMEIGTLLSLPSRISSVTHVPVPVVDAGMLCAEGVYACGSLAWDGNAHSIASAVMAGESVSVAMGSATMAGLMDALSTIMGLDESVKPLEPELPDRRSVICPCMDVTRGDMERMSFEGYGTINRMRRFSGLFMGPCQGARCYRNTFEAFTEITGREVDLPTVRPPLIPVYLGALALADLEEEVGR